MLPALTPTGVFFVGAALAALLIVLVIFLAALGSARPSRAAQALERGRLREAVRAGAAGAEDTRVEDLLAAAFAARHLLELSTAGSLLERALALDPRSGEVWVEQGLTLAHRGRLEEADAALVRALGLRSDLAEPITLHRAWVAMRQGDNGKARRFFEEIEAPLENKLRADLGTGEVVFSDWFRQAAELWQSAGQGQKAAWAASEARRSAPESRICSEPLA